MKINETIRSAAPARFPKIGASVEGTVTKAEVVAVPDFVGGRVVGPKIGVDGPVTQVDITLDVNGISTVLHTRGGVGNAISKALKGGDLNVGDYLSVQYVADEVISDEIDPAKVYEAKHVPAAKI